MGVERIIAKEAGGLIRRRPEKFIHVSGTYLISAVNCEAGQAGRAAYFLLRHVDDLLDGDLTLAGVDPSTHIASIRSQIETDEFSSEPEIVKLAQYSLSVAERRAQPGDNPRKDILDSIDTMMFDYQRRQSKLTLTAEQLVDYYHRTFSPIHNLLLILIESPLRATDIEGFCLSQGRVYSVTHLEDDWKTGIINIPAEVLEMAGLTPYSSYEEVKRSTIVKQWNRAELQRSRSDLMSLRSKFKSSGRLTSWVYNAFLTRSLLKLTKNNLVE